MHATTTHRRTHYRYAPHWYHPFLGREETGRLLSLAQAGDRHARDQLILCHQRLVVSIAETYRTGFLGLDDLVSAGNRGLFQAIRKYEAGKDASFRTYAKYWIRHEINLELETAGHAVRLPRWVHTLRSHYRRMQRRIIDAEGYTPSFGEVCDRLGLPDKTRKSLERSLAPLKANTAIGPDDVLTEDDDVGEAEAKARDLETLRWLLAQLEPAERDLIAARWGLDGGEPMDLRALGRREGLSGERIRQRLLPIMQKLRDLANGDSLQASA